MSETAVSTMWAGMSWEDKALFIAGAAGFELGDAFSGGTIRTGIACAFTGIVLWDTYNMMSDAQSAYSQYVSSFEQG
ncbi:MAG TPA: hypothetical protein VGR56_02380 [Nitrososphaerales archaeon]|nr:hypothetical protein [Nitrososphaerales archaeon]